MKQNGITNTIGLLDKTLNIRYYCREEESFEKAYVHSAIYTAIQEYYLHSSNNLLVKFKKNINFSFVFVILK